MSKNRNVNEVVEPVSVSREDDGKKIIVSNDTCYSIEWLVFENLIN